MTTTVDREGHQVLDFDEYMPHLISVIANRVSAISSQQYLERFGLGTVEMRIISSLAYRPGMKASEVCELVRIDKGAASRGFSKLDNAGYLCCPSADKHTTQKRWSLSSKGHALHEEFMGIVLHREALLLKGLSDKEAAKFKKTLRHVISNIAELEDALQDQASEQQEAGHG